MLTAIDIIMYSPLIIYAIITLIALTTHISLSAKEVTHHNIKFDIIGFCIGLVLCFLPVFQIVIICYAEVYENFFSNQLDKLNIAITKMILWVHNKCKKD